MTRWKGENFLREWWPCRTKNFLESLRLSETLTDFWNLSSEVRNGMKGRHDRWWNNSPKTQVTFFTFNFSWPSESGHNSLLLLLENIRKSICFVRSVLFLPISYKILIFCQFLDLDKIHDPCGASVNQSWDDYKSTFDGSPRLPPV